MAIASIRHFTRQVHIFLLPDEKSNPSIKKIAEDFMNPSYMKPIF